MEILIHGVNPLIKNLLEVLKTLKVKLGPLNLELIILVHITVEKYIFSEVMEVLVIVDNPSMIYMHSMLKPLIGKFYNLKVTPLIQEEDM